MVLVGCDGFRLILTWHAYIAGGIFGLKKDTDIARAYRITEI